MTETTTAPAQAGRASLIRRTLRSPMLHFLLIGGAIFAIDAVVEQRRDREIRVTPATIERIEELWRAQTMRAPTDAERASLIEMHVREELLYREARALGLDRDDTIIRRRLAQKIAFLAEDIEEIEAPGDDALAAHYAAHADRYRLPDRVSFAHVFFAGGDARPNAAAALADLARGAAWRELGDPFMLRREYLGRPLREIDANFAGDFARALPHLPIGEWSGPLQSSYGFHLVRLDALQPASTPPFADVRERVALDWMAAERERRNESRYAALRDRYQVVIEDGA